MREITPEYGYHPCVMRNEKDMRRQTQTSSWKAKQARFFRADDMRQLAERCERKFGWEVISALIYELCEERVTAR